MDRRGFLGAILAAAAAPAIVKAANLMPVRMLDSGVLLPDFEEGIWMPTIIPETGMPYTVRGMYHRVGKVVTCVATISPGLVSFIGPNLPDKVRLHGSEPKAYTIMQAVQ